MTLEEIRASGLLELYVIGDLSSQEKSQVEGMLISHPELKSDLLEIESALNKYAQMHQSTPPLELKDKILAQATKNTQNTKNTTVSTKSGPWKSMAILMIIAALAGLLFSLIFFNRYKQSTSALEDLRAACDSIEQIQNQQVVFYQNLFDQGSDIYAITPTPKYPNTQLYLFNNSSTNRNYLQLKNLPTITSQQAFQLWALKGTDPPLPLTVFTSIQDLIEVDFESDTDIYAITIEPAGGSQTPTLDNLIGTIAVQG